jgi:hypothetical protein
MYTSILEFLPQCPCDLLRTGVLQLDHLQQVGDAGEIVFFVRFGGEGLDIDGDGREWFLLFMVTIATY